MGEAILLGHTPPQEELVIVDNLLETEPGKVLDATQGKVLGDKVNNLDQQIGTILETGIPKYSEYEYPLVGLTGQTEFTIPLDTFDNRSDTTDLFVNTTYWERNKYSTTNPVEGEALGYITLNEPLEEDKNLVIKIKKYIPAGEEGFASGTVLAVNSVPQNRVQGLPEIADKLDKSNVFYVSTWEELLEVCADTTKTIKHVSCLNNVLYPPFGIVTLPIYGDIHITDRLDIAFGESNSLVIEVINPEDPDNYARITGDTLVLKLNRAWSDIFNISSGGDYCTIEMLTIIMLDIVAEDTPIDVVIDNGSIYVTASTLETSNVNVEMDINWPFWSPVATAIGHRISDFMPDIEGMKNEPNGLVGLGPDKTIYITDSPYEGTSNYYRIGNGVVETSASFQRMDAGATISTTFESAISGAQVRVRYAESNTVAGNTVSYTEDTVDFMRIAQSDRIDASSIAGVSMQSYGEPTVVIEFPYKNGIVATLDDIPDTSSLMSKAGSTLESYTEKLVTLADGVIDLSLGNVFRHTLNGVTTYSITNTINEKAHSFTLMISQPATAYAITFPASVKWQGGTTPDLSTVGKTYVLTFMTVDGGTTWLGMFGGEF